MIKRVIVAAKKRIVVEKINKDALEKVTNFVDNHQKEFTKTKMDGHLNKLKNIGINAFLGEINKLIQNKNSKNSDVTFNRIRKQITMISVGLKAVKIVKIVRIVKIANNVKTD